MGIMTETFVNAIRDRYFDKEGYLNPNKERIKLIFKTHSDKKQEIVRDLRKKIKTEKKQKERKKKRPKIN